MVEENVWAQLNQEVLKLLLPDYSLHELLRQWCKILDVQQILLLHQKWGGWDVLGSFNKEETQTEYTFKQDYLFSVADTQYQCWLGGEHHLSAAKQAAFLSSAQALCDMLYYHLHQVPVSLTPVAPSLPSDLLRLERTVLKAPPSLGLCHLAHDRVNFMTDHLRALFSLDALSQDDLPHVDDFLRHISAHFENPEAFWEMYRLHQKVDVAFSGQLYMKNGRTVLWDYIPVVDKGIVNEAFWVFRDVTKQIQSRIEKEILARFPQENPNPLMRIDPEGKVLYANHQAQFLLLYWKDAEREISVDLYQKVQESLRTHRSVFLNIALAGRTWQVMLVPVQAGDYVNFYGMDITERLLAEQRALQARDLALSASEAKSQFLATMSHEIRTPLNAILGMLEVLADTQMNQEQRAYVETSQQAGERLMGLISNLLDFSRIEAGRVMLESLVFSLPSLIQETLAIFQLRAKDKGILLQTYGLEKIPEWLKGDPRRLSQIFFILLDNALKFTERGMIQVHFQAFAWQGTVGVLQGEIEDTGIGVPFAKQSVIFDAFSQADSSTTRKYGGTGLGLSIARQLVQLFDGELTVKNNAHGGATFSFQLCFGKPAHEEIQAHEQKRGVNSADAFKKKWGDRPFKLLVAEDSIENRLLIQAYLKGLSVHLFFAENGQEALEQYARVLPDLILMDIQMPVMDGLTAIQKLREQNVQVPIVVLSADALMQTRKRALDVGGTLFLTKPIRRPQLFHALDQCLTCLTETDALLAPTAKTDVAPLLSETSEMPAFERIDELFPLLPVFFSVRREESQLFAKALSEQDSEKIRQVGHRLRGASAVYGFPYFSEIGEALEEAAIVSDWSNIALWIQRFDAYLTWTYAQLQPDLEAISD